MDSPDQIGTWTYDCGKGVNKVSITAVNAETKDSFTTGAKDVADTIATIVKALAGLLLSGPTLDAVNKSIDAAASLAPGAKVTIEAGRYMVTKENPKCLKGKDPIRFASYEVFQGAILTIEADVKGVMVKSESRIGRTVADDYHPCDCSDEPESPSTATPPAKPKG